MMLYVLLISTLILAFFSLAITNWDFSHPSFLFCLTFGMFEFVLLLGAEAYAVELIPATVIILLGGMVLFIISTLLVNFYNRQGGFIYVGKKNNLKEIELNDYITMVIVLFQIITILSFLKYIDNLYIAYKGHSGSISAEINMYDRLSKFLTEDYNRLNIRPPFLYNKSNLISSTLPYLIIYIAINNFFAVKKINPIQILSVFLLVISIILKGSRSPLLKLFIMGAVIAYIVRFRNGNRQSDKKKFFIKFGIMAACMGVVLVLVLNLMGRSMGKSESDTLFVHIFVYLGAPIENLDNFIEKGDMQLESHYFAEHIINPVYQYLSDKGLISQPFDTINDVLPFVQSANGRGTGNVFTMYYFFLLDFGFAGILPFTLFLAMFYTVLYDKIFKNKRSVNFALFMYAYLLNDLLMLPFSNRFYETVFNSWFLKFVLINWLFVKLIIEGPYKFRSTKFSLKRKYVQW